MACWVVIESRQDWWSTTTPSMAKSAPFRLNHIMSRNRFDSILSALSFTNREVPYEDGFLQMRQLGEAWNQNKAQQFIPSWINVLDESMMEWFKKWYLVFMCASRKPHPFFNEPNVICCPLISIMWGAQIVEGKDRPTRINMKKFKYLVKTIGIMLRIYETIFSTGKCVVLDSLFFVSKGITVLL